MTTRYEFYIAGQPKLAKPHHDKIAGIPNVYLWNGVTITEDQDYGTLYGFPHAATFSVALGLAIVEKSEPLTGDEFRFLRKRLKLTQVELAERFRVSEQTVANYEKSKTEPGPADIALRLMYPAEHGNADTGKWRMVERRNAA